jgi:hypothetical protein
MNPSEDLEYERLFPPVPERPRIDIGVAIKCQARTNRINTN